MKTTTQEAARGESGSSGDEQLRLEERIQKRAYELWLAGGCRHGNDLGDWLQAEGEVLEQRAVRSSSLGADEGPITPTVSVAAGNRTHA